ncbi:hypothetical protein ABKN59_003864 [Abortiporus biennis]
MRTRSQDKYNVNLNLDVLFIIMNLIPTRRDLLAFMKTSKTNYRIGIPQLLGFPIVIKCEDSLTPFEAPEYFDNNAKSFYQYMISNQSRFIYIKDLYICTRHTPKIPPFVQHLLELVFQHSKKLSRFSFIPPHNSDIYHYQPVLPHQSSFDHLRHLNLWYADYDTMEMLRGMCAPLKSLSLSLSADLLEWDYHIDIDDDTIPNFDKNPLLYLANFSSTLELLELSDFIFPFTSSLKFERLRSLHLSNCVVPISKTMVETFPNVSKFR